MTDNPHYVTPEEAEEKTCPYDAKNWGTCMGSQCMAWRWAQGTNKHWIWAADTDDQKPPKHWVLIEEFQHQGRRAGKFREGPTHGYCGMVRNG
jgi:hypothetical protein